MAKTEKQPYVLVAIRKLDTLKILLMILWETKSLDNKKYIALSVQIEQIGKMFGGWNGQIQKALQAVNLKQNSPADSKGETK